MIIENIKRYLRPLKNKYINFKNKDSHIITVSLSERIKQIKKLNDKLIIVFNKNDLKKINSNNIIKLIEDVYELQRLERNQEYYFLINADDVALYSGVINQLHKLNLLKFNILYYGSMQFWGGSVIAPKNSTKIYWTLFNHFYDYHKINSPILLITFNQKKNEISHIEKKFIGVRSILYGEENKNKDEIVSINFIGLSPNINTASHMRWRSQFDVENGNFLTTNHGVHHFKLFQNTEISLFNPKINNNMSSEVVFNTSKKRHTFKDINELNCKEFSKKIFFSKNYETHNSKDRMFNISYNNGSGFYFLNSEKSFSGNHIFSRHNLDNLITIISRKKIERIKFFYKKNILFNRYVSPIFFDDLEFGINWPTAEKKFEIILRKSKEEFKKLNITKDNNYINFKDIFPNSKENELISVYCNWNNDNQIINSFNQAELIAKNKISNDFDLTEFQPSWRNLNFYDKELPHWLGRFKSFNPSANLCGSINPKVFDKFYIILTGESPHLEEKVRNIPVYINLYNKNGDQIHSFRNIYNSGEYIKINLSEQIQKNHENVWYNIKCNDRDLIGYIVQVSKNKSVSIQHLWGY